jgi:hypothetical protein
MTTNFSWTQIIDDKLRNEEQARADEYIQKDNQRTLILVDDKWVQMVLTSRHYVFSTTPFGFGVTYFYVVDNDDADLVQVHYLPIFATYSAREMFKPAYAPAW